MARRDKNIPIEKGSNSISNGFGYLTIPTDISRSKYLNDFYRTGYCILITNYNEIKRRVSIPIHLLTQCEFPNIPGDRGSLVHWQRIPGTGQLVVTGLHLVSTEFTASTPSVRVDSTRTSSGDIQIVKDIQYNGYSISVRGSKKKPGKIHLSVSDSTGHTSTIGLDGGLVTLESSSVDIRAQEFSLLVDKDKRVLFDNDILVIKFGTQEIRLDKDLLEIKSDSIVSIQSQGSSVNVTSNGVVVESDKKVFIGGSKPVLYSKIDSADEILDLSQIGVSNQVRIGE